MREDSRRDPVECSPKKILNFLDSLERYFTYFKARLEGSNYATKSHF
jgi:hypothetical protein